MKFNAVYKCRHCDEIYENPLMEFPSLQTMRQAVGNDLLRDTPKIERMDTHLCKWRERPTIGIADLIAVREAE